MKLWQKKHISVHENIDRFTVGDDRFWDLRLAPYDLNASLAHAQMLGKVGLLSSKEVQQLEQGINHLLEEVKRGTFVIENHFEDIHSKIEFELIQKLGDVGKKIHTARSRNDQVLVALQLYFKDEIKHIKILTKSVFDIWIKLADQYQNVLLPGYTHLQIAMPSSFGLWFSAYAESLIDDLYILNAAHTICDQNPLGSAAGYGSSFPIDRTQTTASLSFSDLKYNVVAAQMGRGKIEKSIAYGLSSIAGTLSRFSMDICLYMSQNFDFISFPDDITTGSSIMPHKKNPDVFELIRGKCNALQALPNQLTTMGLNLPSGYHRDMQLFKGPIMEAMDTLKDCLEMMTFTIEKVKVHDSILRDSTYNYLFTVDALNKLVTEGVAFRDAYQQVAESVSNGTFVPPSNLTHTHQGSMGNLCLEAIQKKFDAQY